MNTVENLFPAEPAVPNGRFWHDMLQADRAQAIRELTNPSGHRAPPVAGAEEDDGGESTNERLVSEAIAEAEREQMLQAIKAAQKVRDQAVTI